MQEISQTQESHRSHRMRNATLFGVAAALISAVAVADGSFGTTVASMVFVLPLFALAAWNAIRAYKPLVPGDTYRLIINSDHLVEYRGDKTMLSIPSENIKGVRYSEDVALIRIGGIVEKRLALSRYSEDDRVVVRD